MVSYLVYQPWTMPQEEKINPYCKNPQGILFDIAHNGRLNLHKGDFIIFITKRTKKEPHSWFCHLIFKVKEVLPWVFVDYSKSKKARQYHFNRLDAADEEERGCLTTAISTIDNQTFQPQQLSANGHYIPLEVTGTLKLFPAIKEWLANRLEQHHSFKITNHQHVEQLVHMIQMRAKNYGRVRYHQELMTAESLLND